MPPSPLLIGLDGDDTLWHSERHFALTEDAVVELLSPWVADDDLRATLLATERRNLRLFGYGVKGFTLSVIETAIEVSDGRVSARDIQRIIALGKELLSHPIELLDGVADTLAALRDRGRLVIVTKGDLFHQEAKVAASGLAGQVDDVEIVAEKDVATYRRIVTRHGTHPDRFVMVGNSVRSDVLPVLELGARAVHVAYPLLWAHEDAPLPDAPDRVVGATSLRELTTVLRRWGLLDEGGDAG
ncbi:MAG TPA: HAD family hydrolase [Acidimicrobiales bacterium]|nr:HAD family hydrolase [Acidimicrobiales bacterium]